MIVVIADSMIMSDTPAGVLAADRAGAVDHQFDMEPMAAQQHCRRIGGIAEITHELRGIG